MVRLIRKAFGQEHPLGHVTGRKCKPTHGRLVQEIHHDKLKMMTTAARVEDA